MKKLAIMLICLVSHLPVAGAEDQGSSIVSVNFKPEVLMTQSGGVVHLKIRLSESGSARIWRADDCSAAQQEGAASYEISSSGELEIPLASLPGQGSRVCLGSTDRLKGEATTGQAAAARDDKPEAH